MYNMKLGILQAIQQALQANEKSPLRRRHGMIRSNAPKGQKKRAAHSPRPRKPAPRDRAELVAKQKKARPMK